jgi:ABC-2 type transport system ATP-binding protein
VSEKEIAIKISHVSKTFKLPHEKHTSLKGAFLSSFSRKTYEKQEVLKDIDFEIYKGEFFGIVGRNGSGKSTLLKCMAGVYTPTKGKISINGKLIPFIELGVGFNPELSGRDNVFLNGALLGFGRKEMLSMYDDIVEFAELESFMDQKLKNYSSGMQVRLAFSIAIRAQGDILVLDEVLAVGDSAFQQKCFDYFNEIKRAHKTIILVTHSMSMVERFCDRAMLIENGDIVAIGKSSKIAGLYEDMFLTDENKKKLHGKEVNGEANFSVKASLSIVQDDQSVSAVKAQKPFSVAIELKSQDDIEEANLGINIRDEQDRIVFSTDLARTSNNFKLTKKGKMKVRFDLENYYTTGKYSVDLHVVKEGTNTGTILLRQRKIASFHVMGLTEHVHSLFHPPYKASIERLDEQKK